MVKFKIYKKKLYRISGLNDDRIQEAKVEINKYLEEGWKIVNITVDTGVYYTFLTKG